REGDRPGHLERARHGQDLDLVAGFLEPGASARDQHVVEMFVEAGFDDQEAGHGFSGIARIWAGAPHWHCGSPVISLVAHGSRTSATGRCVHAGPMGRSPTIDRSYPSSPTSECRVLVSRIMSCTPSSARICAPTP